MSASYRWRVTASEWRANRGWVQDRVAARCELLAGTSTDPVKRSWLAEFGAGRAFDGSAEDRRAP